MFFDFELHERLRKRERGKKRLRVGAIILLLVAVCTALFASNGGRVGSPNIPSQTTASGVWDIEDVAYARQQDTWPRTEYGVEYLVVGGGGGGEAFNSGIDWGSGGSGGQVLSGAVTLQVGTTYTVTVGAGGPPGTGTSGADGSDGGSSTFAGVTASGGPKGDRTSGRAGRDNGGAVADDGSQTGGIGVLSSITGSSLGFGGGGSHGNSGSASAPSVVFGSGQATTASDPINLPRANSGGGGSGGGNNTGRAGASGVVILRMLTQFYSGTVTGSPTVTIDGAYTVVRFTASGSYKG